MVRRAIGEDQCDPLVLSVKKGRPQQAEGYRAGDEAGGLNLEVRRESENHLTASLISVPSTYPGKISDYCLDTLEGSPCLCHPIGQCLPWGTEYQLSTLCSSLL